MSNEFATPRRSARLPAMRSELFHHPDFSLPVITHKAVAELMDAIQFYGEFLNSRGRSLLYGRRKSETAYYNAVARLKRKGIVANNKRGGRFPILRVIPQTEADRAVINPRPWWNDKWSGRWSVLVYDVPESNRKYRDHLRRALFRQRCGCLQNSVWISPRDLRPFYSDLETAASLGTVAHLFEARTVLGRGHAQLVHEAWDFELIDRIHARYQTDCRKALAKIQSTSISNEQISDLVLNEARAYRLAITLDPLLPRNLYPSIYDGFASADLHDQFIEAMRQRIHTQLDSSFFVRSYEKR